MVVIEARALGRKRPLIPEYSVPVPTDAGGDGDGGITLRQLIERVVRAEVGAFQKRQEARRFVRILSEREIETGREQGKVDPGGTDLEQEVDAENAVAIALQAFEDGVYLVLVDGDEQNDLDTQVYVNEDSRLVFLRLTFLAGG